MSGGLTLLLAAQANAERSASLLSYSFLLVSLMKRLGRGKKRQVQVQVLTFTSMQQGVRTFQ